MENKRLDLRRGSTLTSVTIWNSFVFTGIWIRFLMWLLCKKGIFQLETPLKLTCYKLYSSLLSVLWVPTHLSIFSCIYLKSPYFFASHFSFHAFALSYDKSFFKVKLYVQPERLGCSLLYFHSTKQFVDGNSSVGQSGDLRRAPKSSEELLHKTDVSCL